MYKCGKIYKAGNGGRKYGRYAYPEHEIRMEQTESTYFHPDNIRGCVGFHVYKSNPVQPQKEIIQMSQFCNTANNSYIAVDNLCLSTVSHISIAPITIRVDFMNLHLIIDCHSNRLVLGHPLFKNGYSLQKASTNSDYNMRQIQALTVNLSTWWVILMKAIVCTSYLSGRLLFVCKGSQYDSLRRLRDYPIKVVVELTEQTIK